MAKAKQPMTTDAVRRIKSATARQTGGKVSKDSFAARAERAAAKNTPKAKK